MYWCIYLFVCGPRDVPGYQHTAIWTTSWEPVLNPSSRLRLILQWKWIQSDPHNVLISSRTKENWAARFVYIWSMFCISRYNIIVDVFVLEFAGCGALTLIHRSKVQDGFSVCVFWRIWSYFQRFLHFWWALHISGSKLIFFKRRQRGMCFRLFTSWNFRKHLETSFIAYSRRSDSQCIKTFSKNIKKLKINFDNVKARTVSGI